MRNHKSVKLPLDSLGLTNMNKKKKSWDDSSKYQRLLAFHAESDQFHETKPASMKKKNSKNRWKSREWVQLEVKTRARQLKKHISREFVGPWLSAMRAKQTRRPGLTTSASVHLQGLLWKPWTREDSAERIGRGAVTETQNKRPIFLQTYYIFKKFVS